MKNIRCASDIGVTSITYTTATTISITIAYKERLLNNQIAKLNFKIVKCRLPPTPTIAYMDMHPVNIMPFTGFLL